jgi:hypothetical protein
MSNRQLSEPSLQTLSFILRHRELWPAGFQWNFMCCSTCAMGLAHMLWPRQIRVACSDDMVDAFGISRFVSASLFRSHAKHFGNVTPEDVADRIDKHLMQK